MLGCSRDLVSELMLGDYGALYGGLYGDSLSQLSIRKGGRLPYTNWRGQPILVLATRAVRIGPPFWGADTGRDIVMDSSGNSYLLILWGCCSAAGIQQAKVLQKDRCEASQNDTIG